MKYARNKCNTKANDEIHTVYENIIYYEYINLFKNYVKQKIFN